MRVYTICHSQSDQGLHYLQFSAVWSRSTLFAILNSLIRVYIIFHSQQSDQDLYYLPFSAVWSMSTLFAILSNLIRVYTICHSQQSDQGQGLHCHSQEHSDQGLHYLPLSAVWSRTTLFDISAAWSGSTLLAILSSLIKVYTVSHSQQPVQGLNYLPFSAVWSGSTLFTILSSLIRVYTIWYSQQSDQGLNSQ